MKTTFCLPIIKSQTKDILQTVKENEKRFEMFEVWISNIEEPAAVLLSFLKNLSARLQERLLIVFRNKDGSMTMPLEERERILSLLSDTHSFVDIDFAHQKKDLSFIKMKHLLLQTVVSFHDYKKTPKNLNKVVREIRNVNPTILKIATLCKTDEDALLLLNLLIQLKKEDVKAVILGMGKKGMMTRVFGNLLGNEIVFAPNKLEETSAPGQLTDIQLKNIFAILKG